MNYDPAGFRCNTSIAAAIIAPPIHVRGPTCCPSTTPASSAVQNGSTVLTIDARTGPSTASPERKVVNAIVVAINASAPALTSNDVVGGKSVARVTTAPITKQIAAPSAIHAVAAAGFNPD